MKMTHITSRKRRRTGFTSGRNLPKVAVEMHTFSAIKPSAIACEIPTPSLGEVPRPSSSTRTSDFGVASPGQTNQP